MVWTAAKKKTSRRAEKLQDRQFKGRTSAVYTTSDDKYKQYVEVIGSGMPVSRRINKNK